MTTRALSLHADYACRRTGRCCTAGWAIPVEPPVERAVRAGLGAPDRRLPVIAREPLVRAGGDEAAPPVLATDPQGRCVFFVAGGPNACAIHEALGHEMLPMACRQFPRIAVVTPLGVSLSLSHYCPTAAAMLFREDPELEIVDDPPAFPASGEYEGLDARAGLPLLRPGVFLDWEAHQRWEAHAVATLAREDLAPEAALAVLRAHAEEARAWTPGRGALRDWIASVAACPITTGGSGSGSFADALASWRFVAECVPEGTALPPEMAEETLAAADAASAGAAWPAHARPVRRYLAAKAFGSWCGVQGDGLRTAVAFLDTALGVLRVEAARACAAGGGPLDAAMLAEAISAADLLLVHLVSPDRLARRLSRCETSANGRPTIG